jgi:hypothetical protein
VEVRWSEHDTDEAWRLKRHLSAGGRSSDHQTAMAGSSLTSENRGRRSETNSDFGPPHRLGARPEPTCGFDFNQEGNALRSYHTRHVRFHVIR